MERLAEEIREQLEVQTAFTVNIAGHEIGILESTVISWVVRNWNIVRTLPLVVNLQISM